MESAQLPQHAALAHIRPPETSGGDWIRHDLDEHSQQVAQLAAERAAAFGATDWARLAGRWHDLGKYRPAFQAKLVRNSGLDPNAHIEGGGRLSHSTAGALHALQTFKQRHGPAGGIAARVFAYLIASHHAGLYDWSNDDKSDLTFRLASEDAQAEYRETLAAFPPADVLADDGFVPDLRTIWAQEKTATEQAQLPKGGFALWLRLLFSSLVDADFLDTERFMAPDQFAARQGFPVVETLLAAFNQHMAGFTDLSSTVNQHRAQVLAQCRAQAALAPGAFSLTVPTGGGKTLASLGFALEHAVQHGKRRIIYAIPYTSIIEQTADVFRTVFAGLDADPVVEHHSQAEADGNTLASRLACENWDAPLIVTTNVQLFESLFAARTSRCRKLHSLVNSVIVLDEAQQLPAEFLQPILDVLRLLIAHFGVTVVFCTATQPALSSRKLFDPRRNLRGFADGEVREIVSDPDALFTALQRVRVDLPTDLNIRNSWEDIAAGLAAEDCVLAIVNRKADARELWQRLPDGAIYLSTDLCGAHRAILLNDIRQRLAGRRAGHDDRPLRVVSTSLIEAGVDVDFPVVWRALAGLDSIAQAAGRCNREGKLAELGQVHVFVPPTGEPQGGLGRAAAATRSVLHDLDEAGCSQLLADREHMQRYFRHYYANCPNGHDTKQITQLLSSQVLSRDNPLNVAFRTAAEQFRLIEDDDRVTVYVCYPPKNPDVEKWLAMLDAGLAERWLLRKLQRHAVSVRRRDALRLQTIGDLKEVLPDAYRLISEQRYHPALGLRLGDVDVFAPDLHTV